MMDIFNLNCVMIMFKCLCGVVTLFMIGYWMKKFQKDEDVSQVQYISTHSMENVIYPEMTICILEPFLIQAFEETLNIDDYREYLNGDGDMDENTGDAVLFRVKIEEEKSNQCINVMHHYNIITNCL